MSRRRVALPAGYLSKPGGRYRPVKLLDLAILLYHVHKGAAEDDRVGFADANETLNSLSRYLNRKAWIPPAMLESALWSSVQYEELGEFWHPAGKTFKEFLKDVLGDAKFDTRFSMIERKDARE